MSSTSSSECMCSECFNYNYAAFSSPRFRSRPPFYQTMGHPLIYYAQVPSPNVKQRRSSRKDNPNCFVKAFRWYTRDHHPQDWKLPDDRSNLAGFALWLDKKYDEFMLEKHVQHEYYEEQQSSQMEEDTNNNRPPKKRRRPTGFVRKESGDTPEKCNQSFQYILKPKDLSRPPSECCQQTPSAEMQASKRTFTKIRAQSSETTVYDKSNSVPMKIIEIQGSDRTQDISNEPKKGVKALEYYEEKPKPCSTLQRSCGDAWSQCPEDKMVLIDHETECECQREVDYFCCPNCAQKSCVVESGVGPIGSQCTSILCTKVGLEAGQEMEQKVQFVPEPVRTSDAPQNIMTETVAGNIDNQNHNKGNRKNIDCCCPVDDTPQPTHTQVSLPAPLGPVGIELNPKERAPQPIIIQCPCKEQHTSQVVVMPEPVGHKNTASPETIHLNSEAVQTSDHSIIFEPDTYPFFMKIICADKLNEGLTRN